MTKKEIFTTKLTTSSRTYFFDVKKSEYGDLYFVISESKRGETNFEHNRIMIFEENMKDFVHSFKVALAELKKIKLNGKAYSVEEVRTLHPNAYKPWSKDDVCEGKKVKELSQIFGRNEGAVRSRINKLELVEKYIL
ncbi:MAG: DUF3276 family protein [Bacteroidales bacterium]|nr:DUF3276 family protein [Bacteroidales bacterium]